MGNETRKWMGREKDDGWGMGERNERGGGRDGEA